MLNTFQLLYSTRIPGKSDHINASLFRNLIIKSCKHLHLYKCNCLLETVILIKSSTLVAMPKYIVALENIEHTAIHIAAQFKQMVYNSHVKVKLRQGMLVHHKCLSGDKEHQAISSPLWWHDRINHLSEKNLFFTKIGNKW